ncbi:hypothetical protein JOD43_002627 [Pullulanibacillus pueri]|uniref:Uncharacterized protein n=1 Tax=Pullulanibacillus pueri TaxID=1437324 RepID=A0A8J3EM13_9BACL|nr:hypothetical protein [Pullulanibacillus pueri]MBM7682450.1 hypothetical protein [Pullulanibacillus pueri]GGH81591.1 hypothetical protein GCM10007096_19710 [Pullulanibacillus pueri]
MLTFEEKLRIIESFPQLKRKDVSLGRVNFSYDESILDKKNVVYHLHPNGNGYVYGAHLRFYDTDEKGYVNIRDYSEKALRTIIEKSIHFMTEKPAGEQTPEEEVNETWKNREGHTLTLVQEDEDVWNVYAGENLDNMFGTYDEAVDYLLEEGFRPFTK